MDDYRADLAALSKRFACPMCGGRLSEHRLLTCGHAVCKSCVQRAADRANATLCPCCGVPGITPGQEAFPMPRCVLLDQIQLETERLAAKVFKTIADLSFRKDKFTKTASKWKVAGGLVHGVAFNPKSSHLVMRTADKVAPVKVYDYNGTLRQQFGETIAGASEDRRIAVDTRRDTILLPCGDSLVLVNKEGQEIGNIKVGTRPVAVSYCEEKDVYVLSDIPTGMFSSSSLHVLDPKTRKVVSTATSSHLSYPNYVHVGSLMGCYGSAIAASDKGKIVIFDMRGNMSKETALIAAHKSDATYGVSSDPAGNIVVACKGYMHGSIVSYTQHGSEVSRTKLVATEYMFTPGDISIDCDSRIVAVAGIGTPRVDSYLAV